MEITYNPVYDNYIIPLTVNRNLLMEIQNEATATGNTIYKTARDILREYFKD